MNADVKARLDELSAKIEKEPSNDKLYYERIKLYDEIHDYESSLQDNLKIVEMQPDNAEYILSLGNCYSWLKEHEKSIENLSRAIALKPDDAHFYNCRGGAYWNENADKARPLHEKNEYCSDISGFENAISDYSKAIELDNKNPDYYDKKGIVYQWFSANEFMLHPEDDKGYNKKALECFDKAIELEPSKAEFYYNRGVSHSYIINFDKEKARDDFRKASELNPSNIGYLRSFARVANELEIHIGMEFFINAGDKTTSKFLDEIVFPQITALRERAKNEFNIEMPLVIVHDDITLKPYEIAVMIYDFLLKSEEYDKNYMAEGLEKYKDGKFYPMCVAALEVLFTD